jgi:hypothetical protein
MPREIQFWRDAENTTSYVLLGTGDGIATQGLSVEWRQNCAVLSLGDGHRKTVHQG